METIQKSKEIGDLEEIKVLEVKVKAELEKDNPLPKTDVEIQKIERMNSWLLAGQTEFSKMKIRYYGKNYRGVHARRNIKARLFSLLS